MYLIFIFSVTVSIYSMYCINIEVSAPDGPPLSITLYHLVSPGALYRVAPRGNQALDVVVVEGGQCEPFFF